MVTVEWTATYGHICQQHHLMAAYQIYFSIVQHIKTEEVMQDDSVVVQRCRYIIVHTTCLMLTVFTLCVYVTTVQSH